MGFLGGVKSFVIVVVILIQSMSVTDVQTDRIFLLTMLVLVYKNFLKWQQVLEAGLTIASMVELCKLLSIHWLAISDYRNITNTNLLLWWRIVLIV